MPRDYKQVNFLAAVAEIVDILYDKRFKEASDREAIIQGLQEALEKFQSKE